jgi:hypothetical protein
MPIQVHFKRNFNDDDRKVYDIWLRRTLSVYGVLVLFGLGLVFALVLTKASTVAESAAPSSAPDSVIRLPGGQLGLNPYSALFAGLSPEQMQAYNVLITNSR